VKKKIVLNLLLKIICRIFLRRPIWYWAKSVRAGRRDRTKVISSIEASANEAEKRVSFKAKELKIILNMGASPSSLLMTLKWI